MLHESSADVVRRREALEELLTLPGWQYFKAHVLKEWQGIGYQSRMGAALASKDPIAPSAVHQTALEMVRLLDWPANQVHELKGVVDE